LEKKTVSPKSFDIECVVFFSQNCGFWDRDLLVFQQSYFSPSTLFRNTPVSSLEERKAEGGVLKRVLNATK